MDECRDAAGIGHVQRRDIDRLAGSDLQHADQHQRETTYVVSYHAPNGHYSVDRPALVSAVNNPPLKALADDEDGANGVYAYGSSGTFPSNAPTTSTHYWVDVVFAPGA